jgi:hypothetical protein
LEIQVLSLTKLQAMPTELPAARVFPGRISLAYILPTIPHVAQKIIPNKKTHTTTTQLAALRGVTAPEAYRAPIRSMMPARRRPPDMAEVRRPHLSASKKPGIDTRSMAMDDTPDAMSDELVEEMPA